MRFKLGKTAMLAVFSLIAYLPCHAQDKCSDVLKDGAFSYGEYKDNSYFNQIVWSRFLKTTFESSKTDQGGGFGVPIGEIVLGGNYTRAEYDAKKAELQKEQFQQITAQREIQVALMSGDGRVLEAWSDCMRESGGGISARFEPLGPTDVFLYIEYYNEGIRNDVKLTSKVELPEGVTVVSGSDCLKKGKKYVNGKACVAKLRLKSALVSAQIVVDSTSSVATAWLPARMELLKLIEPYTFSSSDRLYDRAHKALRQHRRDINLTAAQIKDGWRFDPSSARTGLQVISSYSSSVACRKEWSSVTSTTFSYGYEIWAKDRHHKDGTIVCAMNPYIQMRRDLWVAQDINSNAVALGTALKYVSEVKLAAASAGGTGSPPDAGSALDALLERKSVLDDL